MGSIGTPHTLYSIYRNLNVRLFGDSIVLAIDIHEYRNNSLGGDFSTVKAVEEYNRLKAKIKAYGSRVGNNLYEIYYPLMKNSDRKKKPQSPISDYMLIDSGFPLYNVFVGKGSPNQITDALKLAVAFGHIPGTRHAIQEYCDKYIGLDCSGFASNYFGLSPKEACTTGAGAMAPMTRRLRKLDDVRSGTAIVFKNGKHVALVDQVLNIDRTQNVAYAIDCTVAESTADQMVPGGPSDGLNYTEYVLLFENDKRDPTKFKILRPLAGAKNGFYGTDVHLANWPEYDFWG